MVESISVNFVLCLSSSSLKGGNASTSLSTLFTPLTLCVSGIWWIYFHTILWVSKCCYMLAYIFLINLSLMATGLCYFAEKSIFNTSPQIPPYHYHYFFCCLHYCIHLMDMLITDLDDMLMPVHNTLYQYILWWLNVYERFMIRRFWVQTPPVPICSLSLKMHGPILLNLVFRFIWKIITPKM